MHQGKICRLYNIQYPCIATQYAFTIWKDELKILCTGMALMIPTVVKSRFIPAAQMSHGTSRMTAFKGFKWWWGGGDLP